MQAAIFINGTVISGPTHAHASSCVPDEDKDSIISGWYENQKKKFVYENRFFYMKEIVLIRHADAENDTLTSKGISQLQKTLPSLSSLYRPHLEIVSSPTERCEHTAWAICTHFGLSGKVNDEINEPANEENVVTVLDQLPDYSLVVVSADFLAHAVGKITGNYPSCVPNLCAIRLLANKPNEVVVSGSK